MTAPPGGEPYRLAARSPRRQRTVMLAGTAAADPVAVDPVEVAPSAASAVLPAVAAEFPAVVAVGQIVAAVVKTAFGRPLAPPKIAALLNATNATNATRLNATAMNATVANATAHRNATTVVPSLAPTNASTAAPTTLAPTASPTNASTTEAPTAAPILSM
jgi:hypothetical protein